MAKENDDLIIHVAVAAIVVSTVAISLRFWSRGLALKGRYSLDDWLALVAWLLGLCSPILNLADAHQDAHPVHILKVTFANDILFHLGVGFSKLSALAFYYRCFPIGGAGERFVVILYVLSGLSVAYMLFAVPTSIWGCTPVDRFWYTSKPGHCINVYGQALAVSIYDVILDIIILVLPMSQVLRLQMALSKRILVAGVFLFGYLSLVVSIGHMVASIKFLRPGGERFISNGIELAVWSEIEVPIVVFSISLPSCFWFFKRVRDHGLQSAFTWRDYTIKSPLPYRTSLIAPGGPSSSVKSDHLNHTELKVTRLPSEDDGFANNSFGHV